MKKDAIYCYRCGIPLTDNDEGYPVCTTHGTLWKLRRNSACAEAFIINSKNEVLLIQRGKEPMKGTWALPGGFSQYGEDPQSTALREAAEETGWLVKPTGKILGVYLDSFPGDEHSEHRIVICYICKPQKQQAPSDSEALDCRWFALDKLPQNLITTQVNRFEDYHNREQKIRSTQS